MRRYTGTPPEMRQPPLSDNMLCVHLGGAKEVRRWHGGRLDVHTVELGALTIMPADQANRWLTSGPIDFAHLLLSPQLISEIGLQDFDRDAAGFHLADRVGFRDPYIETLFAELMTTAERRWPDRRLYADSLLTVLTHRLVEFYSTLDCGSVATPSRLTLQRGGMAPWRLQRVVDYLQTHLGDEVGLAELTELTGLSRAQFFRAFKQSTGVTPHRYLMALRLDRARILLADRTLDLADVGAAVGFRLPARFSSLFRQRFGITPRSYRSSLL